MLRLFALLVAVAPRFLRSRRDLLIENLALRQQLSALRRKQNHPRLDTSDRVFGSASAILAWLKAVAPHRAA